MYEKIVTENLKRNKWKSKRKRWYYSSTL